MKKIKKYITIFLIIILTISFLSVHSKAFEVTEVVKIAEGASGREAYDGAMSDLIHKDYSDTTPLSGNISDFLTTLVVVVKYIGVAVAIIILLVLGTKYVVAAPGERADIKKSAVPYVIGAFVLFATSGLLSLIQSFAEILNVDAAGAEAAGADTAQPEE